MVSSKPPLTRAGAGIGLVLLGTASSLTGPAWAQEVARSSISWQRAPGAESCIDELELRRRVELRVGRPLDDEARAESMVRGIIAPEPGTHTWVVRLTVVTPDHPGGTREIRESATECRQLDATLVLAISLMIDPEAALGESEPPPVGPESSPAPMGPPVPMPVPVSAPQRVHRPSAQQRPKPFQPTVPAGVWHLGVRSGPVFGVGTLPEPGLGMEAQVFLEPPSRWRFLLGGQSWREQKTETESSRGSWLDLWRVTALACPPLLGPRPGLSFFFCGGVETGPLTARGFGLDNKREESVLTGSLVLSGGPEIRIYRPLWIYSAFTLLGHLVRPTVSYRDANGHSVRMFGVGHAGINWQCGLELRFPS